MRADISAPALAALASGDVVMAQLVLLQFPSGDKALNNSTWDLDWDSITYRAAFGLGAVSAVTDKPGEVQGMTVELSGVDPSDLGLALDDADEVQDAPFTLRTALLSATTFQTLDAPVDFVGRCDTMGTSEDAATSVVNVSIESKAVDLLRGNPSTYGDADQQAAYPGDRAMEYGASQNGKPVIWPGREWFYKK